MYVNLENNKYDFEEFLTNDNLLQGRVEFIEDYSNKNREYFLHKIKEYNGAYSIFIINYFNDCKISSAFDKYEFLLSIDSKNKIIIYVDCYSFELKTILEDLFKDYQIWNAGELTKHIQKEYEVKINRLFNDNTENFKSKFKDYKERYQEVLENYKTTVERDYITDRYNYKLCINDLGEYSYYNLENLQNYLKNTNILNELVEEDFKEYTQEYLYNSKLYYHAEIQAKKELLKQIQENPSEYVKLYLDIKNKTENVGKTLNVITKDNQKVRVNNLLYNDGTFRTVKGWDEIEINDICKITYGKKTLYSLLED
ncbi:TPA: hypothetical protein N2D10_003276 [Clostridium botulinum]|nr:hypothetical protein [Clostridium botulinum]